MRVRLKKNWKERFSELRSVRFQPPSPSPFNYLSVVTVTSFQYVFFLSSIQIGLRRLKKSPRVHDKTLSPEKKTRRSVYVQKQTLEEETFRRESERGNPSLLSQRVTRCQDT